MRIRFTLNYADYLCQFHLEDLWKSATILLTLFSLPPKPELVPK